MAGAARSPPSWRPGSCAPCSRWRPGNVCPRCRRARGSAPRSFPTIGSPHRPAASACRAPRRPGPTRRDAGSCEPRRWCPGRQVREYPDHPPAAASAGSTPRAPLRCGSRDRCRRSSARASWRGVPGGTRATCSRRATARRSPRAVRHRRAGSPPCRPPWRPRNMRPDRSDSRSGHDRACPTRSPGSGPSARRSARPTCGMSRCSHGRAGWRAHGHAPRNGSPRRRDRAAP